MKSNLTVKELLGGEYVLRIPAYQRAYSWDKNQYEQFWNDIMEYLELNQKSQSIQYFIGHILLEKVDNDFYIVDGQQRITTTVILLSVLQKFLKKYDGVKLENFFPVGYDLSNFKKYITHEKTLPEEKILEDEITRQETASMKRCLMAFLYFIKELNNHQDKAEAIYNLLLSTECTTRVLTEKIEAVKCFIFENNRGKPVSKFELFKSLCIYHLYIQNQKDKLKELDGKMEKINRILENISHSDDDLLRDTTRIYFNNLSDNKSPEEIIEELKKNDIIANIDRFTDKLLFVAQALKDFTDDRKKTDNKELWHATNALFYLGITAFFYPFIIKAYLGNVPVEDKIELFRHLEHLIFRNKLIPNRAKLEMRIRDVFESFQPEAINNRVEYLCHKVQPEDWWSYYWSDKEYANTVEVFVSAAYEEGKRHLIRYVLFKYEYSLWKKTKQTTLPVSFFDMLDDPEIEHIAPQTENAKDYDTYDEDFLKHHLNSLGNFILIPKRNNGDASNLSFKEKCNRYKELGSLYMVQKIIAYQESHGRWDRKAIAERTQELKEFIEKDLG